MRVSIDAVLECGKLCEPAICYTGELSDPNETKYDLRYYVKLAKQLEAAGAHILGVKDMAGLCKPEAARRLIATLKQEVGVPIHFHTHDTSGIAAASVLAAAEAGADAIDAAMDSMSGLTSQPNLGAIVEALRGSARDTGLDRGALREVAGYWEAVRRGYLAFESDMRAGSASVFEHGMPGGQYSYGRNAHCCAPPAQIRTWSLNHPGSYLGCLTANRWSGHGWRMEARATGFRSCAPVASNVRLRSGPPAKDGEVLRN